MIKSSCIKSFGTDLLVEFSSGKMYTYEGMASHAGPLGAAPSAGKYFNSQVRPRCRGSLIG